MREFIDLNYNINYKVINSADYGVPQRREKVIFNPSVPTHNKDGTDGLKKWVCGDFFSFLIYFELKYLYYFILFYKCL